jgi:hypothetical protein
MILFPIAVVWLIVVLVWVLRNSRNEASDEPVWRRWRRAPRSPRDGGPRESRSRAGRKSATRG